jgi:hypothetical protein
MTSFKALNFSEISVSPVIALRSTPLTTRSLRLRFHRMATLPDQIRPPALKR